MPRGGQPIAATARAFAFPLSWSVTVCAGVVILALCAAIYGTIGYVDEKRIAVAERVAVEHAIRTNADLQRQLDRARDALPASGARIEPGRALGRARFAIASGGVRRRRRWRRMTRRNRRRGRPTVPSARAPSSRAPQSPPSAGARREASKRGTSTKTSARPARRRIISAT